jgi:tripartite-type tricarboxylate transporter receptor subunit TctC
MKKGQSMPPEVRQRLKDAMKAAWADPEARQRLKDAMK